MRLLRITGDGEFTLSEHSDPHIPAYAILSHTWAVRNEEEVTFEDMSNGSWRNKPGYRKLQFCARQAARDRLQYFWVDTCCIKKSSDAELSEALNSMFRWYQKAAKCYAYLADVPSANVDQSVWEPAFRRSRWFTRGWTLQELIAPLSVHFFSSEGHYFGDRASLAQQIHETTGLPISALQGGSLSEFTITEKLSWVQRRTTKREEDMVYCLFGLASVYMPIIYGEGKDNALIRLQQAI
ncbi:heterokaryon incompatibility protein-domain-containing protein, partial [Paraphoma chrysanthemicola]